MEIVPLRVFEISTNHRGAQSRALYGSEAAADEAAARFLGPIMQAEGYRSAPTAKSWRARLVRLHAKLERQSLRYVNVVDVTITPRDVLF